MNYFITAFYTNTEKLFFYYVHAFMVCTFPVLEKFRISLSIDKIFLCVKSLNKNPV